MVGSAACYGDDDCERKYGGTEEDYRGAFRRDRDRILYSSAFRRLAGKTQVVAAGEPGDYHNRMTNTLKVAQLGRRLAEKLGKLNDHDGCPDPDLVEAACLAHDLGHPPFGHAGEQALMRAADAIALEILAPTGNPSPEQALQARAKGGFEGNAQTFRILVRLSARQPETSLGLDLTRATLDATVKYPWQRGTEGKEAKKWNFYPNDLDSGLWVRQGADAGPGARKSFEAQIMDWSDDVAYACHDVEDFFRAGIIPLDRLLDFAPVAPGVEPPEDDEPPAAREFFDFVGKKWVARGDHWDRSEARSAWRSISQLMMINLSYTSSRASKVAVNRATSRLITYFLDAVSWSDPGACRHGADLTIAPEARLRCDLLQELIWFFVIDRQALASQQLGQMYVIAELLRVYALGGDERLLPDDRRDEADKHGDHLRACIDHVASLTEPAALALHHRLTGVRTGSHSEPIWHT